jgi:hypothetical protein
MRINRSMTLLSICSTPILGTYICNDLILFLKKNRFPFTMRIHHVFAFDFFIP